MHRGYIKLWRKTDESGLLQMPETFALFAFLLIKATHKPRKIGTPYGMIELDRGQYISGRLELASALKLTERKVRTAIDRLVNMEIIATKPTSRFTVYTIVNYNDYQSDDTQPSNGMPTDDQQTTNRRPADDQQTTTKQTQKHNKNEKNGKYIPKIDRVLLDDWLKVRNAKRAGELTETAFKGLEREALKAGIPVEDAIRVCCERSWISFKAEWFFNGGSKALVSNAAEQAERVSKRLFGDKI